MRSLLHTLPGLQVEARMDRAIGEHLRALRLEAGLSLTDLATKVGLPIEELADHEDGTLPIPLSRASLLGAALGVSMNALLPVCHGC